MQVQNIRNFAIVAHIDHGKSTLSDRIIEICNGKEQGVSVPQQLDSLELERERGITIKSHSVALDYQAKDGQTYRFNLLDTPGHVDFSYEVSRSLAACEGVVLLVDATQGVEAQTLANCYLAVAEDLEVLVVLNKVDVASADVDRVSQQIEEVLGLDATGALAVSGKTGEGVAELLEQIIREIPAPQDRVNDPVQALVIDSWFDSYRGVMALVRVMAGSMKRGDELRVKSTEVEAAVVECGNFIPETRKVNSLTCGQVGYVCQGLKEIRSMPVGDTLVSVDAIDTQGVKGFQSPKPRVFASMFPADTTDYAQFVKAVDRLCLNDAAITSSAISSDVLGLGFRLGFLGQLHMEIVAQRLEREHNLDVIVTPPAMHYIIDTQNGETVHVTAPSEVPDVTRILSIKEPLADVVVLSPQDYIGAVIDLLLENRSTKPEIQVSSGLASITCKMPMAELARGVHDQLQSRTRGRASLDYTAADYIESDIRRLDILINGDVVPALAEMVHSSKARNIGLRTVGALSKMIPRQMFEVAIQAALGGKIIARANVKAVRKNVTAKCYGGDITRKKKLLERQKKGKKMMKALGNVQVPREVFTDLLAKQD